MLFAVGLLNHVKAIQTCIAEVHGEAVIDVRDLSLQVKLAGESRRLRPQFIYALNGKRIYKSTLGREARGFIGWRPYEPRFWEATADKTVFKRRAESVGLRTPPAWYTPDAAVTRFIIKPRDSSFAQGIRGPFETIDENQPSHQLGETEFYEAFIPGRIAKAWYLDGELLVLELLPPAFVVGDGRTSLSDLASRRSALKLDQQALTWIVASQGYRLNDVPADGRRVVVDFRYASPYDPPAFENLNVLPKLQNTELVAQFRKAGALALPIIPADLRHTTLITMDAVVDTEGQAWFLEMNSNPSVHPDAYPALLRTMFGADLGMPKAS